MEVLSGLLSTAILSGGVLALAALGELLAERVGVLNLGVEGLMALGAMSAVATVGATHDPWLGFLAALLVGGGAGILFALATVVVRASQVLCGMALTMGGLGLSATIGRPFAGQPAGATFSPLPIPLLDRIPVLGPALFQQSVPVYLAFLLLPAAIAWLLFRTRHGLTLRAIGENPAACDAAGIRVAPIRFCYVVLGAAVSASAGAYLTLGFVPSWSDGVTAGRGWIAVALVIFAGYRPWRIVGGALLFGLVNALGYLAQARNWGVPSAFLAMLPYGVTLLFMIAPGLLRRGGALIAAPAALGVPYYRDEK
ncbi:ABC transporter permease [Rhizosaccharibacter radicis]|uniref:ABC transporter permease n=1 Tax=Rhizosaccharibacter radicis TaxID=2782605 RepID=A0ABT1VTQ9_9PROT|nr:ABC transporter permease [Acetobacteraceae bacterium KSS12]